MITIVSPDDRASVLASYEGARSTIWMFHPTFKRLVIRLSFPDNPEALYVVLGGCTSMTGSFEWFDSHLVAHLTTRTVEELQSGAEPSCTLRDDRAGFLVRCTNCEVVLAPAADFPESFEYFQDAAGADTRAS